MSKRKAGTVHTIKEPLLEWEPSHTADLARIRAEIPGGYIYCSSLDDGNGWWISCDGVKVGNINRINEKDAALSAERWYRKQLLKALTPHRGNGKAKRQSKRGV